MSAEISYRADDRNSAYEAAFLTAEICVETGHLPQDAYTVLQKAGQYSGEIIFCALRNMGIITGDIDTERFQEAVRAVRSKVLPYKAKHDQPDEYTLKNMFGKE